MLRAQNLRPAAIAAQRALRQTISSADWVGEERARRVLGAVLGAANEPEAAARHMARAADVLGMKDLAAQYTDRYIDIGDSLDIPNYWTVGTAYSLLSAEANFILEEAADLLVRDLEKSGSPSLCYGVVGGALVLDLAGRQLRRPDWRETASDLVARGGATLST